jgi:hypothetical protein
LVCSMFRHYFHVCEISSASSLVLLRQCIDVQRIMIEEHTTNTLSLISSILTSGGDNCHFCWSVIREKYWKSLIAIFSCTILNLTRHSFENLNCRLISICFNSEKLWIVFRVSYQWPGWCQLKWQCYMLRFSHGQAQWF